MKIKIEEIDDENFEDIPQFGDYDCKSCVYWEYPDKFNQRIGKQEAKKLKQKWFSEWTLEQNAGGVILYVDETPAGYCQFGPPHSLPSSMGYPTGKPVPNKIYISCIIVKKEFRRQGFALEMLNFIKALVRKKKTGIQTFAGKNLENFPSGPLELYEKAGFVEKKSHKKFPLVILQWLFESK